MNDPFPRQMVGLSSTAVATFGLRIRGRRHRGIARRRGCGLGFAGDREEGGLVGPERFGLGSVEPAEELVEPPLHAFEFLPRALEAREQFADHPLQHFGIVGHCGVGVHADTTRRGGESIPKSPGNGEYSSGDTEVSAGDRGPRAPLRAVNLGRVDPLEHELQVGRRHLDLLRVCGRRREREAAFFESLVENHQTIAVPPEDLDAIARLVPEDEEVSGEGVVLLAEETRGPVRGVRRNCVACRRAGWRRRRGSTGAVSARVLLAAGEEADQVGEESAIAAGPEPEFVSAGESQFDGFVGGGDRSRRRHDGDRQERGRLPIASCDFLPPEVEAGFGDAACAAEFADGELGALMFGEPISPESFAFGIALRSGHDGVSARKTPSVPRRPERIPPDEYHEQ